MSGGSNTARAMAQQALKLKAMSQLRQVIRTTSSSNKTTNIANLGKDILVVLRYIPTTVFNKIQSGISAATSAAGQGQGTTDSTSGKGTEIDKNKHEGGEIEDVGNTNVVTSSSVASSPANLPKPNQVPLTQQSQLSPKLVEESQVDPPIEPDEPFISGLSEEHMNWQHVEARTRYLVSVLQKNVGVLSPHNLVHHVESLFVHVYQHHDTRNTAVDSGAIKILNKIIKTHPEEVYIVNRARELLAILGQIPPLKGRGIRILSIDGGGVRYNSIKSCWHCQILWQ